VTIRRLLLYRARQSEAFLRSAVPETLLPGDGQYGCVGLGYTVKREVGIMRYTPGALIAIFALAGCQAPEMDIELSIGVED
jgi:hypothetical protein